MVRFMFQWKGKFHWFWYLLTFISMTNFRMDWHSTYENRSLCNTDIYSWQPCDHSLALNIYILQFWKCYFKLRQSKIYRSTFAYEARFIYTNMYGFLHGFVRNTDTSVVFFLHFAVISFNKFYLWPTFLAIRLYALPCYIAHSNIKTQLIILPLTGNVFRLREYLIQTIKM